MTQLQTGRRRHRWSGVRLMAALLVLVLCSACGSALVSSELDVAAADESRLALIDAPLKSRFEAFGDGLASADRAAAPLDDIAGGSGPLVGEGQESSGRGAGDGALIVRTASLELEVEDVAAALLGARIEIAALGGYVAGSDEYDQGDHRWATVSYRLPVDRFSAGLDALRGLSSRVARETTQSQEVTAAVVDLDARIANLRASEAALVEIMERAGRIEDVLAVQTRLEDVRGQIERLVAQRDNLADQAALSTLSVTWFTPVAALTAAQQGWNLGTEVDAALAQTLEALQRVASLGVWMAVVALPLLGMPLLVLAILVLALRRRLNDTDDGPDDATAALAAPPE